MCGIRHLAATAVATAFIMGAATFSVRAQFARRRVAETAPIQADASPNVQLGGLRFRLQSSRLAMRWDGAAGVTSEPRPIRRPTAKLTVQSAGQIRIGRGDTTFVSVIRQGAAGGPAGYYQLQIPRGGEDVGGAFILNAQNLYTPQAGIYGLDLMCDGQRLRVSISRQMPTQYGRMLRPVMTTVVRDLRELARENPQEVRVFIAPALLELTGIDCFPLEPGDVYRAFDKIGPDPTVVDHVRRLLPDLDADDFARRARAATELSGLGAPGVLAVLRTDQRRLSPTQRAALDGFVGAHTLDPARLPEDALHDAEFLIQCVAYSDPTVREAAAEALTKLAGREVHVDASKPAAELRRELLGVIYPGAPIADDPPNPDASTAYGFDAMDDVGQREQIRQARLREPEFLANYPMTKQQYALRELMEVRRVKGLPIVKWGKKLEVATPTRVGVTDASGDWVIFRAGEIRKGTTEASFLWSDARRDGDEGPWRINVSFSANYLAINAQYGENATVQSVSMNIVNGGIMFSAGRDGRGRPAIQAQGDSLRDLAKQNPQAVRKYVAPILHDVFGLYFAPPDPGLAYEVFDDLPPSDDATRRLEELLPDLDSDLSADRAAAGKALEDLALPGILAAIRCDQTGLSFEQRAGLGAFLASHGVHGKADEARHLRKDVSFLLACLEFEDVEIRKAAKEALKKETGKPIELDVNLAGEELSNAVEAVRTNLDAQPAEKK